MSVPREEIAVALFAILEGMVTDGTLKTASRSLRSWDDVAPGECPAAFLVKEDESRVVRRGFPAMVNARAGVFVYVKNMDGRDTVPATAINAVLSALENALRRQPADGPAPTALFPDNPDLTFGSTLGGLCYFVAMGDVTVDEGFIGVDSVAYVPIDCFTTERP